MTNESDERCQRCGIVGQDRRALFMACFYEMQELNINFQKQNIDGQIFYTLRVCKDCRAKWMESIQHWFNSKIHLITEQQTAEEKLETIRNFLL